MPIRTGLSVILCALALHAPHARADRLTDALSIVPPAAVSVVAIPDLGRAGADIEQLIDRMGRSETVVGGKPIEQLKGLLGISAGFDEGGSLVMWFMPDRSLCLAVPASDPASFIDANIRPGADGRAPFAGRSVFARPLARHVLLCEAKEALESYSAGEGAMAALEASVGQRGVAVARAADLVAWGSAAALADAMAQAQDAAQRAQAGAGGSPAAAGEGSAAAPASAQPAVPGVPLDQARLRSLLEGLQGGLVAIDFDPLGVGVRAVAATRADSALARITAGSADANGSATGLSGLPKANFYVAASVDVRAMGGGERFIELARTVGVEGDFLPGWIAAQKDAIRAIRIAAYPSRLGIVAGGVLNDSACIIECDDPPALRDALKQALMGTEGKRDGLRFMPGWETDRKVKDELVADGFELKTEPLGPREAGDVDQGTVTMRQLATQALFGSRGMHGFMKPLPGRNALIVTFSQRPDVLARAVAAVEGGASLGDDAVIKAMQPWLLDRPQVAGYLALGQVVRAARQIAELFGGGAEVIPEIPARTEPVGGAVRFGGGTIELAAIVPTGTVAFIYDNARNAAMGGGRGPGEPARGPADPAPKP